MSRCVWSRCGMKVRQKVNVGNQLQKCLAGTNVEMPCIYRAAPSAMVSSLTDSPSHQRAWNCQTSQRNFAYAVLDALPQQIAVLSSDGIVVSVNAAWRKFGHDNARAEHLADVGINYLAVCLASRGEGAEQAHTTAAKIAAVLAGSAPLFNQDYDCHSAFEQRWFNMQVVPLQHGWNGAVIVHTDITARRLAEVDLCIAAIAFESSDGMMVTDAFGMILRVNRAFSSITGYSPDEVVGQRPSMLSSGRHDAAFYSAMWAEIHLHGHWEGEVWNRRKNGQVYPQRLTIASVEGHPGKTSHYVASLSDMTVSKAASDEIEYLAFYDPLTRLPNRRLLLDRLRMALAGASRSGHFGLVMFIDLDHFKTVNDTLGHHMGDLLLQQVAKRIESCLRQTDTVARLGGDEFVVLVNELSTDLTHAVRQSETLCTKILHALNAPYMLDAHRFHSTPSIGATLFHGDLPHGPERVLKQSDIAMYQAKQGGRNCMRFFDQGMQDSITARARLEDRLRQAVESNEFELYYQVQVDQHGRAFGAEALLRWLQEDGSFVSPVEFIPLAEETGLILPLGKWVLLQACRQLQLWKQDPLTRDLVLAINVSARQFHQASFVGQVKDALVEHDIRPSLLKLELTESLLLDNIEETISSMRALTHFGVSFSLDDFGTGYSSLQYLKRLPLDQLKIDQSFIRKLVHDTCDQTIVMTIISMARSLGLDVIAEGVEAEDQRSLLTHLGCAHFQGYLSGRPVPVADFIALPAVYASMPVVHPSTPLAT